MTIVGQRKIFRLHRTEGQFYFESISSVEVGENFAVVAKLSGEWKRNL